MGNETVTAALAALEAGKEMEAREILERGGGEPAADAMLGTLIYLGIGGDRGEAAGLKLLESAVERKSPEAALDLAGFLITSNRGRALELYRLSYEWSGKKMLPDEYYE